MKTIVYVPPYNQKHSDLLARFAKGIPNAKIRNLGDYEPCDIAVIFGLVKRAYKPTLLKQEILDKHQGERLIVVESAFVNRGLYWAVGFGGIHGGADFKTAAVGPDRWQEMGVKTRKWQQRPNGPVVVCGQLPRDTNVQNTNHIGWCRKTTKFYKDLGVPVLFRPHPRSENIRSYNVAVDLDTRPMNETLEEARCVVIWNSTSGVDALIKGVPVIACSPDAMAWPVASHSRNLDKLRYPSRTEFFNKLGYSQWTADEFENGAVWNHLMKDRKNA